MGKEAEVKVHLHETPEVPKYKFTTSNFYFYYCHFKDIGNGGMKIYAATTGFSIDVSVALQLT